MVLKIIIDVFQYPGTTVSGISVRFIGHSSLPSTVSTRFACLAACAAADNCFT